MVNRKHLAVMFVLLVFCAYLSCQNQDQLRPYRLIHADSLKAQKVNDAYISELIGKVHFFYGDTEFYSDRAFLYEEEKTVRMLGNVRVYDDTLSLKAKRVTYFRQDEKLELDYEVYFMETHKDSTWRTFQAEHVEYFRENKYFIASDSVEVYDSRENVSGTCGYMNYNANEGFGYLRDDPELKMAKNDTITIKSRKIEYYDDYKKIVAIFEVETFLQEYYLTSDFLIYYAEEEKATYRGQPKLTSDLFDAKASEVTLFFTENKINKANLDDSCRVDYKISESEEKQNWVTSDLMDFFFENDLISTCHATSNVESYYLQKADPKQNKDYILNEATSDKLILYMDDEGYIENIGISGHINGKYSFEN